MELLMSKKERRLWLAVAMGIIGLGMVWYSGGFGIALGVILMVGAVFILGEESNGS